MTGPRLNVSRTVKCPCGNSSIQGTAGAISQRVLDGVACSVCGRRLIEQEVKASGRARFAFVRAHEVA
jgi:hypothetical protein